MEQFFIVTPPGFEAETEREIAEVWPDLLSAAATPHDLPMPKFETVLGGLQFECEPFAALQLNFFLKTPSRILWRLAEFKVRDFPKLHGRLQKIDVAARLGSKKFNVKADAQKSRLGHEKRIEETARKAWGLEDSGGEDPAIYLRIDDDLCTVSLETSGEHLHRRGWNQARGPAPVRETLASFCLRQMIRGVPPATLQRIHLVDPMCGSGTLLTEAGALFSGQFLRDFRFQQFKGLPKLFQQASFAKNYRTLPAAPFASLRGFDIDTKVLEAAKLNQERWQKAGVFPALTFQQQDLFSSENKTENRHPTWLVCNPPYNERLPGLSPQKTLEQMIIKWQPERIGVLWSEDIARTLRWPSDYVRVSETPVRNGGLEARFSVFQLKSSAEMSEPKT